MEQRERYVEKVAEGLPQDDQSWEWKERKHTFLIDPVPAAPEEQQQAGNT